MSSRLTFGTIKRIVAILIAIAIVLAAGVIVGQAPAIFGVEEEDPTASITFEDQRGNGSNVTIQEVSLSDGGYVVITDGGNEPLAVSERLEAGTHENVTIERAEGSDGELLGRLTATVHRDTADADSFAYEETDGEEDRPYLEDGFPVSDTAAVTSSGADAVGNSFVVESLSAPASATTNETIEIVAEIHNPTEFQTQQSVDVRLDGTVLERQVLELEAGETREVTFAVDTTGTAPGNRTIGVYTDADGALARMDLEFHTVPGIEIVDADAGDRNVTVNAAIPAEGFVAVEDNGTVLGTSDALSPGEHENVTVTLEDGVDDETELTAVLYEGEPDDVENATAIEHEGERVETTFTLAEDGTDGGPGGGSDNTTGEPNGAAADEFEGSSDGSDDE